MGETQQNLKPQQRVKVMTVFGTRPEAIKMAPVIKALRERPAWFSVSVVVTGQHREMLDQVLDLFGIIPDDDLEIMTTEQTLTEVTVRALQGLEEVLARERPDCVLVQGDTTTAMAAALASFYHRVPVGHVEAGLRTNDPYQPFPEEINRRLISTVATWHFAPTSVARDNLLRENVPATRIWVTGNTVIDALQQVAREDYAFPEPQLREMDWGRWRALAVTAHRRENWGEPLRRICQALRQIVEARPDVLVVFPVHLNPVVQRTVHEMLDGLDRVILTEPLPYGSMANLLHRSYLVLTDSGGLQEEAPSLGRPVLVLREVTERPEGVAAGTLKVVGTEPQTIVRETLRLLDDQDAYQRMARAVNPYGDGKAAERIALLLARGFGLTEEEVQEFTPGHIR